MLYRWRSTSVIGMTTTLDALIGVRRAIETGEARRLRIAASLTQQEAARRCGDVSPSALARWECGERFPRGRDLRVYARLLARLTALDARDAGPDRPEAA
jgi:DNA-binding transcriptional regulator YiaG